ncbi:MAG: indole-3-glycerol phosphate synthase TrpC [Candidatus Omnitrophota bacterium]
MPNDFLKQIIEYKQSLLKEKKAFYETLKNKIRKEKLSRYCIFKKAISAPGQVNLIAEIKKASPSKGIIRPNFDCLQLAKVYVKNGAAALSILTEDKFFLGKIPYLRQVSENLSVPVLTKDFIIDEVQIYEAFYFGTSAILLIVAILDDKQLRNLMNVAADLDLDCLVEIHNEKELNRALKAKAEIIGVNNRNLRTFEVDLKVSEKLIPQIPKDKVIVAESGIKAHQEIKVLEKLGAHAVLIGETFLREADVAAKVKEVMHGE